MIVSERKRLYSNVAIVLYLFVRLALHSVVQGA